MRYNLVDLRLFVAVADAGNVSRGAAACFLAPSSASLRIKALESNLRVCSCSNERCAASRSPVRAR